MPVLSIGLSALAVFPFFFLSQSPNSSGLWMPVTHDMILHFDQMKSFYRGLESGEFYPRWEEDTNRGFGAPTTSYYPPGVYYLTAALYGVSGNWMAALLGAYFLMMVASAASIYLVARRLMDRGAAIAAMICYIFLPYHILDQYQRGALAESLGFAFMPLMLFFGERLMVDEQESSKSAPPHSPPDHEERIGVVDRKSAGSLLPNTAFLAMTVGCFLWCHPPTAYQFLLSFALFVVLLAWVQKSWKGLFAVAIAIVLGLSLSAAYLFPAFVEQNLIHRDFISNTWPYDSTYLFTHGSSYDLIEFTWIFNVLAIVAGALVLLVLEPGFMKASLGLVKRVWLWLIVGCFASFMMTRASYPLTRLIPKIDIGVFAWRMLGVTTVVAALIAGACAQAAFNASKQQRGARGNSPASLAAVTIVGGAIFMAVRILAPIYGAPSFSTAGEHVNVAMMPMTGPVEPLELPKVDRAELAGGAGAVEVERWDPEHRLLKVELSAPDKLLIRTFNFPGWLATVDGEPAVVGTGDAFRIELEDAEQILIRADTFRGGTPIVEGRPGRIIGREPLGDIVIELHPGAHRVALDYVDTAPRRLGVLITIGSFFLVLGIALTPCLKSFRRDASARS